MHRLFVALRPPPPIRALLIQTMSGVEGAHWQDDEQLHITLRFIGEVERRMGEDVALALSSIHFAPLTLRIEGAGAFDKKGRLNALWAGVRPHDAISRLHRKVDQALVRIGLPPEGRAYLPHVTLARLGGRAGPADRWLADRAGLASDPFEVRHFGLYESHLGRDGASYELVERYPLVG